jgi:hypothetical protein
MVLNSGEGIQFVPNRNICGLTQQHYRWDMLLLFLQIIFLNQKMAARNKYSSLLRDVRSGV